MNAVAINDINAATFADVLQNGAKVVENTGCAIVPEFYLDEYDEWLFYKEIERRLKEPNPKYYTEKEMLTVLGMTEADLEGWEDVEIE